MARRKNAPESIRLKHNLSERLRELRTEFFGERGGPDMARTLGILVRTWYNYESGVTVPAEIILQVVELTSVEPVWLLRGEGPKFRPTMPPPPSNDDLQNSSVASLLRTALERLEQREKNGKTDANQAFTVASPIVAHLEEWEPGQDGSNLVFVGDGKVASGRAITPNDGPRYLAARKEWVAARQELRHLRVADESMAPIVAEGAHVTYAEAELASVALHDKLVVTWVDARPVVRWFQHCGRFALLRAENVVLSPSSTLVELEGEDADQQFHRVEWICTPH